MTAPRINLVKGDVFPYGKGDRPGSFKITVRFSVAALICASTAIIFLWTSARSMSVSGSAIDVSGVIQIIAVFGNFVHSYISGIAIFFRAELTGIHNPVYVFRGQPVLPLALVKLFRSIDKEYVTRLFTLFGYKDTYGDA